MKIYSLFRRPSAPEEPANFDHPPIRPPRAKRTVGALLLLSAGAFGAFLLTVAQQADQPLAPAEVYKGWDLSGMTEQQKRAMVMILDPIAYNEAANTQKNPDQLAAEAKNALAITNPVEFALRYPPIKSSEQIAEEQRGVFAMSFPREYELQQESKMTPEQLKAKRFSMWSITHPGEFNELVKPLKTQEDLAAEEEAAFQITHPEQRPRLVNEVLATEKPAP